MPLAITGLLPVVILPVFEAGGVGDVTQAYATPIAFLVLGAFMLTRAVEGTGLHERMALAVLSRVPSRPAALVGGFMLVSAALSMWMLNTATTLMLLPVALFVIERLEENGLDAAEFAPALLLGIAYAANIGGFATLVGTPAPALAAGVMEENYGVQVGFATWMAIALPVSVALVAVTWVVLCRLFFRLARESIEGVGEIVYARYASLGRVSPGERRVIAILVVTALLWVFRPLLAAAFGATGLSDAGIAVTAAVLLFLVPSGRGAGTPLLDMEGAKRAPWGILLLLGGGLALAQALQDTGVAAWISDALTGLERLPVLAAAGVLVASVMFLTEITTGSTIVALLPIVAAVAASMGKSPLVLVAPFAIAACCAYMLPVATPPNAIVYETRRIRMVHMMVVGLVLNFVAIVLITLWVPFAVGLLFD